MTDSKSETVPAIDGAAQQDAPSVDPQQWVQQYGDYLFRYANARLRDANAAEEVVQDTFLNGIRYHEQYSGAGTERAWLLGILKRKIIDFVRKRNRQQRVGQYEDDHDPTNQLFDAKGNWNKTAIPWSVPPERPIESSELWQIVKDCLTHLPSGQADVFTLSVMEGMDSDEICDTLSITPSNLWVRMHRARLGLAKCVGSKWFSADEVSNDVE
ncbi:MAG: sigma-70 family RNA polymerase sigma factor [Planctomycetota bacterium]